MIGVFLITHASLGEVLVQCVAHVLNTRPAQLAVLGVAPSDDPHDLVADARAQVAALDSGDGVLILTDIFGASPANLALRLLSPEQVEALAGVNLPMLLRVLTSRETYPLAAVLDRAITGACDGVLRMKPV